MVCLSPSSFLWIQKSSESEMQKWIYANCQDSVTVKIQIKFEHADWMDFWCQDCWNDRKNNFTLSRRTWSVCHLPAYDWKINFSFFGRKLSVRQSCEYAYDQKHNLKLFRRITSVCHFHICVLVF